MRIAIVGSGISGLVCAHRLSPEHDVTVFEAQDRVGGHTHTVDVEVGGEQHAVDTGFIVYNETTYPHFTALLEELEVATRPTEMSFGVACERSGLEWSSRGLRGLLARRTNLLRPGFYRMVRDVLRFNEAARELLEPAPSAADGWQDLALGDYLRDGGYSRQFVDHYVVPMGAAIWSADPKAFLRFPAVTFVRFFANHGLLETSPSVPWRVVEGGSARYVEKLIAPFQERIRTGSPVRAIRRHQGSVELFTDAGPERFDEVILAVHSDEALRMLLDPSGPERWLLRSIRYQRNDVVLHTDERLMPRREAAWASWNYRIPQAQGDRVLVTYDMNRLQGIESDTRFLVTLNEGTGGGRSIDPNKVLRRFVYDHPVFDAEALRAQARHPLISGRRRTHFCGAYWGHGFHEDGVRSALSVCEAFEASAAAA